MIPLLVAITLLDVKNAECLTACSWSGYDTGTYIEKEDSCLCGDLKPYESVTHKKRVRLPTKPKPPTDL